MKRLVFCLSLLLALHMSIDSHAATIDLNTWTAESYQAVSGFPPGDWVVSPGGTSVEQINNGQPTVFYSDFNAIGTNAIGTITVTGGDDDFIGFVLGFQPGDASSTSADYLLVDWKSVDQYHDFDPPSMSPGGDAPAGLAVSRVNGLPDADEFWQHDNLSGTPGTSSVTELARGSSLGNTGWTIGNSYEFGFNFTASSLQVLVDGTPELDISGSFNDGRLGFYNFSQAGVTYSSFTVETIPEPGTLILLFTGIAGLAGYGIRRRKKA